MRIVLGLLLSCLFSLGVSAQVSARDPVLITEGDRWAWDQIANQRRADFNVHCVGTADERQRCNVLSAAFVADVLKIEATSAISNVIIIGAQVQSRLDLNHERIPRSIALLNCRFEEPVVLESADFERGLYLDGSTFERGIDAANLHTKGDVSIGKGARVNGALNLDGAELGSDLILAGATLKPDAGSPTSAVLKQLKVDGNIDLDEAKISGRIDARSVENGGYFSFGSGANIDAEFLDLDSAKIGRSLDLGKAKFGKGVRADKVSVGGTFSFEGRVSNGKLSLLDADIGKNLQFSGIDVEGRIEVDRVKIGGSFIIDQGSVSRGKINLVDATIGGDVFFHDSKLIGVDRQAVFAKGINLKGTLYAGPALEVSGGTFDLLEAKVDGNVEVSDSVFNEGLHATLIHVDGSVFIHDTDFRKKTYFNGAYVAGHFDIAGCRMADFDLSRSTIGHDFRIAADETEHKYKSRTMFAPNALLSLRHSHIGVIQDEQNRLKYDPWPKRIDVEGLSYGSFGVGRGAKWAESWLGRQVKEENASARGLENRVLQQPYRTMATYYRSAGEEDSADEILQKGRDLEADYYWGACGKAGSLLGNANSCLRWVFLDSFGFAMSYGLGDWQIRMLLWVVGFTIVGVFVIRLGEKTRKNSIAWSVGASLNRLIPVLELREDFTKLFSKPGQLAWWQSLYFAFHAIAGFVLASFIVTALAGLTPAH